MVCRPGSEIIKAYNHRCFTFTYMIFKKPLFIVVTTIVVMFGGVFLLIRGCLSKFDERSAIPPVISFERSGKTILFAVVNHETATSYSNKGGLVQKSVSRTYYIQTNDATNASRIAEKKIRNSGDIKNWPVAILGKSSDHAWIFMDELMAFDPFTLEQFAGKKIIEEKNPQLAGKLPAEKQYYEFDAPNERVLITTTDARHWSLDTKSLVAKLVSSEETAKGKSIIKSLEKTEKQINDSLEALTDRRNNTFTAAYNNQQISYKEYSRLNEIYEATRDLLEHQRDSIGQLKRSSEKMQRDQDDRQRVIENLERANQSYSSIYANQDTFHSNWIGLYANAEMEDLYDRFQYSTAHEETSRRSLRFSTATYEPKYDAWMIDRDHAVVKGQLDFLQGGFLLDNRSGLPVHLENPDGYLVVSRSQVGREGKIIITRLGLDGKSLWEVNTGLSSWTGWSFSAKYLAVGGTDNKELSSDEMNVLMSIDLQTGHFSTYDYFKDKVR
jgi:hypothetical protein